MICWTFSHFLSFIGRLTRFSWGRYCSCLQFIADCCLALVLKSHTVWFDTKKIPGRCGSSGKSCLTMLGWCFWNQGWRDSSELAVFASLVRRALVRLTCETEKWISRMWRGSSGKETSITNSVSVWFAWPIWLLNGMYRLFSVFSFNPRQLFGSQVTLAQSLKSQKSKIFCTTHIFSMILGERIHVIRMDMYLPEIPGKWTGAWIDRIFLCGYWKSMEILFFATHEQLFNVISFPTIVG